MRSFLLLAVVAIASVAYGQRQPLDHSVYDGWQNIGQRLISNDGKWVVYTVDVQEGDNELVIQSAGSPVRTIVPRGYGAVITEDNKYVIFRIRPYFKDMREARIKKKKPEDTPKDTLAIVELGSQQIWKKPQVKSFKTPEKAAGWVAYHLEKKPAPPAAKINARQPDNKKITDSLARVIDSLQQVIESMPKKKKKKGSDEETDGIADDAEGDDDAPGGGAAGTDLVLHQPGTDKTITFPLILEYLFSKNGEKLLLEQSKNPKDSLSRALVLLHDLKSGKTDTVLAGGNDFRNFEFSEDGSQLAFVAERDAKPKDLQKLYKLWYYKTGMDTAVALVECATPGMKLGMTVSEHGNLSFSKNGKRLFFGMAPIPPAKDTTLVEMDLVKVDVWHYKEDYLQTVQLSRRNRELERSFQSVYHIDEKRFEQLASEDIPAVWLTAEGDGDMALGTSDAGRRVESQWTGNTLKDIYLINVKDGSRKLVKKDVLGFISPAYTSPSGKYIMWYESKPRHYFVYDGDSVRNVTAKIKVPLHNEDHDSPSDPSPYGVMRWSKNEDAVYIYDQYGVWKVDPAAKAAPSVFITGRNENTEYRYLSVNPEERAIENGQTLVFRRFNKSNKNAGVGELRWEGGAYRYVPLSGDSAYSIGQLRKAKDAPAYLYTKESYVRSPNLYITAEGSTQQLSFINLQQHNYTWGTAELYKWKAFNGKTSEGILYKPDNFNADKKYPIIFYFYEKLSDGLNNYIPPSPTPSRLNISFFVSRGYLVFAPDISYTIGHPAKSAYDYIVSAAKDLAKKPWVDEKNMGIQGQSWGGIQVAQLITMTDIFKAAWAGAPVANMTSAYGGIRWESGANRQFQYEKTQSRIGATLWEKPELYIENSPLFHLPKVKTPLVIMHNDADGAVPWYQGIELFTGLRRLGKQVWMLNYNGEAHNLVQRKNRKDIQVREQQFFDWLLKGEKPAKWITEGVPAVNKGRDWGLEIVDE